MCICWVRMADKAASGDDPVRGNSGGAEGGGDADGASGDNARASGTGERLGEGRTAVGVYGLWGRERKAWGGGETESRTTSPSMSSEPGLCARHRGPSPGASLPPVWEGRPHPGSVYLPIRGFEFHLRPQDLGHWRTKLHLLLGELDSIDSFLLLPVLEITPLYLLSSSPKVKENPKFFFCWGCHQNRKTVAIFHWGH